MTDETPRYKFDVRVAKADREGYYYTDWSKAQRMTVIATDKQGAVNEACRIMGDPPSGRYWLVKTDKVYPA